MARYRLDQQLVDRGLVSSRSQAASYIKLGMVTVYGTPILKPGHLVSETTQLSLTAPEQYVSRAALKLASVATAMRLQFTHATVLDVGSSTGGFTDYALRHGARRVIAVEVGTDQLHPTLRNDPRIELHEKTDIRDVTLTQTAPKQTLSSGAVVLTTPPDIIVADVSFISLREILPHLASLSGRQTKIIVMLKPQFEASYTSIKHKGVIKNDSLRRDIIKEFETWLASRFIIDEKADSEVTGSKGNRERFYALRTLQRNDRRLQ